MGTTATRGLPYPEPTGLVKVGAADFKALAEAVDTALGGAYYFGVLAPAPQSVPDSTGTTAVVGVDFESSVSTWAEAGGVITYTGPDALAVVTGFAAWATNGAGYRRSTLVHNGATVGASRDTPEGATATEQSTSAVVKLTSGDTLSLQVRQTSGAALNLTNALLRIAVVAGI
jgi:hypothetical protein